MEKIKIKYHNKDIPKLSKIEQGDWIDLYAAENKRIYKGEYALISLGISMKLPEGYEAHIAPRSSTFKKWGIIQTNSVGICDNSYSGNLDIYMFPVYCVIGVNRDALYKDYSDIKVGDKICQFRIMKKQPEIEFEEVEFMEDEDRGGFGSTGSR